MFTNRNAAVLRSPGRVYVTHFGLRWLFLGVRRTPVVDPASPVDGRRAHFAGVVGRVEPGLRRALVAAYGVEVGTEATADALAWAWEHLERVDRMDNAGGYLWRVGQTSARRSARHARWEAPGLGASWSSGSSGSDPWAAADHELFDPALPAALARLTPRQRTAVLLVHGYGYTLAEAAAAMGCGVSSLRNHLARGLSQLRTTLGVDPMDDHPMDDDDA
jgi:DNA-directed RNA polymerase specialized sigma24 family protein